MCAANRDRFAHRRETIDFPAPGTPDIRNTGPSRHEPTSALHSIGAMPLQPARQQQLGPIVQVAQLSAGGALLLGEPGPELPSH